ncbi:MAG: T9SS type A sorting domain-containing protein [Dysgonamonadaceae bacterium]|nr:T9SS type A sorting domain-containing protein [Dysgonamonadaceae bacterium]
MDNHTPALSAPKPVFKDPDSQQIIDIISSEDNQTVFYSQADRKIRYNGWDGSPGSLSIYSTQGEQICLFRNTKAEEWDVSYLKQGIYIVKIHKKDKFITKKIVIF